MKKLIGQRFGTLTVIDSRFERTSGGNPKHVVTVKCDCGRVYDKLRKGLNKAAHPTCKACFTPTPKKRTIVVVMEDQARSLEWWIDLMELDADTVKGAIARGQTPKSALLDAIFAQLDLD